MDASWVLWPIAVLMAVTVAALVRWSTETRTVVAASVVVFLFVMMVAMFVATAIYFTWPGTRSLVLGLWVAAALMSVSVFPVIALLLRESHDHLLRGGAYVPRRLGSPTALALWITGLVLVSELLMGRSFQLAAGAGGSPAVSSFYGLLVATIASPWFLFPMSLEMGLTLFWLRTRLPIALSATLAAQAAMMFLSPPAIPDAIWWVVSGALTSAAMGLLLTYLIWTAYRGARFGRAVRGYIVRFLLVTAVMGLGLGAWLASGDLAGFALATVLEMGIFFSAIVVPERFGASTEGAGGGRAVPRTPEMPNAQ